MTKPKPSADTLNAARELIGRPLAIALDRLFRCMELAEEEISTAKAATPEHAERLHQSFRALQPSQVLLENGAERLYRAHCQELLERVRAGKDLRGGTRAELAALLSLLSLQAPLDRHATILYWRTFEALLPGEAAALRKDVGPVSADTYDTACADELERTLRRKLAVPERAVAPTPAANAA